MPAHRVGLLFLVAAALGTSRVDGGGRYACTAKWTPALCTHRLL